MFLLLEHINILKYNQVNYRDFVNHHIYRRIKQGRYSKQDYKKKDGTGRWKYYWLLHWISHNGNNNKWLCHYCPEIFSWQNWNQVKHSQTTNIQNPALLGEIRIRTTKKTDSRTFNCHPRRKRDSERQLIQKQCLTITIL